MRCFIAQTSLVAVLALAVPSLGRAQTTAGDRCATPRTAVEGLLYWQQPEHFDGDLAAACLDLSREPSPSVGSLRARQIKAVLDAQGLFVEVDNIPNDSAFVDSNTQRARYVLFRQVPDFYVEKVGGKWLWSAHTVDVAPSLYDETLLFDTDSLVSHLPRWMRARVFGVQTWQWLGLLLIIVVALLARLLFMAVAAHQVRKFMERRNIVWAKELLASVTRPVGTLLAAGFVTFLLPVLKLAVRVTQVGLLAARVVAVLSAVLALYHLVNILTAWLAQKAAKTETRLDDQLVPLVNRALKVFIVAVGVIFVLQNLDIDVGGLLAGLGLGGLAFALAAKDTVANLFGSTTIFLDRPFHIGDWVVIAGTEGIVEQVGFRSTRVRTFYNSLVSVPNSRVADSVIDNYGARVYRRVKTMLGVTYDTTPEQMQAFCDGIRAIIQANPHTRKDYYEIHFRDFGPASLDILVYFFLKVPGWSEELRERHNIFLEIMRLARELGVSFAFPTQTLHIESMAKARELAAGEVPSPEALAEAVHAFGPEGEASRPGGPKITKGYFASP